MEIRVLISPDGSVVVESISILEDLWHDFLYFKAEALAFDDRGDIDPSSRLIAKRFRRAALLSLFCYSEGVLNGWLKKLLSDQEWRKAEKARLPDKISRIQKMAHFEDKMGSGLQGARELRNMLAHLKPGGDGKVYDEITAQVLDGAEMLLTSFFSAVEGALQVMRHPDTRKESEALRKALGSADPNSEGYTRSEEK